jgi:methionyl-tRNA synthetase
MPSFSAKVYEQMAIKRELKHETAIQALQQDSNAFFALVAGGHVIGDPQPIFREIKEAEAEEWKKAFGGRDQ